MSSFPAAASLCAIIIVGFAALTSTTSIPNSYAIAKPGCIDSCGNVSIPFPFGLGNECSLSYEFLTRCNNSTLFLVEGDLEVKSIQVDKAKIRIMQPMARDCNDCMNYTWYTSRDTHFYVNKEDNMFVVVGCLSFAVVTAYPKFNPYTENGGDQYYLTGCAATCNSIEEVENGNCNGVGCCQITSLPKKGKNINLELLIFTDEDYNTNGNFCTSAFVVDKNEFKFSSHMVTKEWQAKEMPMVMEWTIGDNNSRTCSQCHDNICVPFDQGKQEYQCFCMEGYEGNPYLSSCQDIDECVGRKHNCSDNQTCKNTKGSHECHCKKGYHDDGKGCSPSNKGTIILILGIALATILLLILGFSLYFAFQKRKSKQLKEKFFSENGGIFLQQIISQRNNNKSPCAPRIFTAEELERATTKYDQTRIIGRGGYGIVYKGDLDGETVAIKKSKIMDPTQVKHFINEVIVLSQINHKNIVKLIGCCLETEVPLLVYEFIPNGTLCEHLHNKDEETTISWPSRLRIAAETADVLSYLHDAAYPPIIHRDVKSGNILLDHNYTAKVSDFGASRLVPKDEIEVQTIVQGTLGYLDPEYMETQHLTEKSDVYSFGVLMVELLTGRRVISNCAPENEKNLSMHFLSLLKENRLNEILDKNITNEENIEELQEVAMLAQKCLNVKGEDRPTMKEVAMELEGLMMKARKK